MGRENRKVFATTCPQLAWQVQKVFMEKTGASRHAGQISRFQCEVLLGDGDGGGGGGGAVRATLRPADGKPTGLP